MAMSSLVLGGFVLGFTIIYMVKRLAPIIHYTRYIRKGETLLMTEGSIIEKVAEENKLLHGMRVNICFPKYEYTIGDKKKYYQSTIRYKNACIGQTAEIHFCERTGEAWIIKDIPLIIRDLLLRVITIVAILTLLVLTETAL